MSQFFESGGQSTGGYVPSKFSVRSADKEGRSDARLCPTLHPVLRRKLVPLWSGLPLEGTGQEKLQCQLSALGNSSECSVPPHPQQLVQKVKQMSQRQLSQEGCRRGQGVSFQVQLSSEAGSTSSHPPQGYFYRRGASFSMIHLLQSPSY